jgi:hypothetical protein
MIFMSKKEKNITVRSVEFGTGVFTPYKLIRFKYRRKLCACYVWGFDDNEVYNEIFAGASIPLRKLSTSKIWFL